MDCTAIESFLPRMSCKLEAAGFPHLSGFLDQVNEVWNGAVLGISVSNLLLGLLILYLFFIARSLFARFVVAALTRWARRTENQFDDELLKAIQGPLKLIPIIMGIYFGAQYMVDFDADPNGLFLTSVNRLVQSFIAGAIFWTLFNLVEPLSHLLQLVEKYLTPTMTEWLKKSMRLAFIVLGAGAILEIWGIPVGPLIASLGLFGVAVALGAQDLFKNLIGGLSILIERRFHVGDWVLVDGVVEGTVETIGFRSTMVRRFDKAPVFVPNDVLSNSAVTNFSEMTHRRIYWKIGVEYRTTIDQLRQIRDEIETYILENEAFAAPSDVATFVRIDAFNDSSIDIMLYCFTKTTVWGEWLEIKEALALRLKEIIEGAGTGFAFPSQSVYVEQLPGSGPELFVPPTDKSTG